MASGPMGIAVRPLAPVLRAGARATTVSTSVFHASQVGHCPDHLGDSEPHCWQT